MHETSLDYDFYGSLYRFTNNRSLVKFTTFEDFLWIVMAFLHFFIYTFFVTLFKHNL